MNNKPSNKRIGTWIKNHITPHLEWVRLPNTEIGEQSSNNKLDIHNLKDELKDNVVFGIKIKWRF